MRVLCLHGRGSNTEVIEPLLFIAEPRVSKHHAIQIFRMQTAAIRSFLEPEYHFEFVEGRWPHLEGNWSVHTTDFSKSKVTSFISTHLKELHLLTLA